MRRGLAGLLSTLLLMPLAGCSNTQVDVESLTQQFAPIVIKLARNAVPYLPPGQRAIAMVGVFVLDQQAEAASRGPEITYLHIRQTVDGTETTTVLAIDSQRRLRVDLAGRFTQEIEQGRIVIATDPQTESTIVVSEATAIDPVHHADSVMMTDLSANTERLDFDSGHHVDGSSASLHTDADVQFPRVNLFGPRLVNGAVAQSWNEDVLPDRYRCATLPADGWRNSFEADLTSSWTTWTSWCLRTSAERYGFLHARSEGTDFPRIMPNVSWTYVIWADPAAG